MLSDKDDNRLTSNNWAQVLHHADKWVFPADTMMCFLHNGVTALTFHAENGERVGIMCSKCFKFFRPGSFGQHAKDCMDSLAPNRSMIKHWKDSTHLCTDIKRKCGKDKEFGDKKSLWVMRRDEKIAYVVHPSWCTSTSHSIRAMCITDGDMHVCALNGLQHHMKAAHMKGEYTLWELDVMDVVSNVTGGRHRKQHIGR
jgi:hypothetical protein